MQAGGGMGSGLNFRRRSEWPENRFQFRSRNCAGAKQNRFSFAPSRIVQSGIRKREDGGFDADLTRSTVEDEINVIAEAAVDVLGGGRGKFGEAVSEIGRAHV